jgi:hypothetical protein
MDFFRFFSWEVRFFPLFNTFYISELKRGKNEVKNGNHKKPERKGRKRAGKSQL